MTEQDRFGFLRGNDHWSPKKPAPPTSLRSPVKPLTTPKALEILQQQADSGTIPTRSSTVAQLLKTRNGGNDNDHKNED